MANGTNVNMIEVNGANYNTSGDSFGDASWTDTANFGTGNFLFAENNTFTTGGAGGIRSFDIQQGGRFVFRHNTSVNAPLQTHAIGHDGPTFRDRGPRAFEIYQNSITFPTGGPFAFGMDYEGGTSLWWGNTASGFNSFINLDYRRATGFTYAQIQPPNGWGYCGSLQTGPNGTGPSVWDQNIGNTGWGCIDGTGRGKGDLLVGSSWPNVTNQSTGTQAWARQAPEPMYVWANNFSGGSTYVGTSQSDTSSVNNRDYFVELPNPNNAATFNGTAGIGNGTLLPTVAGAYTNAPECSYGVGYWQTSTSTLYTCNATWGTVDEWMQMNTSTPGTALTGAILTAGAVGTPSLSSWVFNGSTSNFTVGASQGSMGGSITVNGVTYPVGTPTQSLALNNSANFTYATTSSVPGGLQQVVSNGFVTFGATNAGFSGHVYDLVLLNDTNSAAAVVFQFFDGQPCYCVDVETNGAVGFHRSGTIAVTPGHRYSYSLLMDEIGGTAKAALYDPSSNFSQVGSLTVVQNTGFNFSSWRFGNAETGTSPGTTTSFEDLMLDWTVHKFPNVPAPTWTAYYTPFTYPHPLVSGTTTQTANCNENLTTTATLLATGPKAGLMSENLSTNGLLGISAAKRACKP
jgi:hypothetical protein